MTKEKALKNKELYIKRKIKRYNEEIKNYITKLNELKKCPCYTVIGNFSISGNLVDEIFNDLRKSYGSSNKKLNVIIHSTGGDIDAAYNLAQLFRRYGSDELNFYIPRLAKSAATLLACGGNKIFMTPIAELGPLDPQIMVFNPIEQRLERFSPLHIESTLDLIRDEFENGNKELANGLIKRLQFPLTLGSFKKTLDIAKQYLVKLLTTRMFKENSDSQKAVQIAKKLTEGYADHGFCIDLEEAKSIGLIVEEIEGEELEIIWQIHNLNKEKQTLIEDLEKEKMEDFLKKLPPEMFDKTKQKIQNNEENKGGTNDPIKYNQY